MVQGTVASTGKEVTWGENCRTWLEGPGGFLDEGGGKAGRGGPTGWGPGSRREAGAESCSESDQEAGEAGLVLGGAWRGITVGRRAEAKGGSWHFWRGPGLLCVPVAEARPQGTWPWGCRGGRWEHGRRGGVWRLGHVLSEEVSTVRREGG